MSLESVYQFAKDQLAEVYLNEPMSKHTTFRIGGACDLFIVPQNEKSLIEICNYCRKSNVKIFVMGNGSNLLVSDKGIRGVVIKSGNDNEITVDGTTITASAGTNLSAVCEVARKNCLTGLEFAYGIPGSVGGAVFMNAGAYGGEMKDVVVETRHLSNLKVGKFTKEQLDFGYRKSAYTGNDLIITGVTLELKKGNYNEIDLKMKDLLNRRRTKQPLDKPSAGSVFKRPEGNFAGALIEQCGLKGKTVGGAMVSDKHCGFIVNAGGATASDVLDLVEVIKKTVLEQTGVNLECEIKTIGEL